eukprot:jgi/Astpho2/2197/Aster-03187
MVSTSISPSEPVSDGAGSTINGKDAASETSGLDVPRASDAGLGMEGDYETASHGFSPPPTPEDFSSWPDAPCLYRLRQVDGARLLDPELDPNKLESNTGEPIHFESDLFSGCAVLWTKGLPTTPEGLFQGQKRKSAITIQGRFKQQVPMVNVISGPEFSRPYKNLPAIWFVEHVLLAVARRISPRMRFGSMKKPYMQVPIMHLAKRVIVSEPGHEPQLSGRSESGAARYYATLDDLGGENSGHFHMSPLKHQDFFDTDHIYTWHIYQDKVDLSTFQLHLVRKFDLFRYLDGQPLQSLFKDRNSGKYMFSFETWHERLLPEAWEHYKRQGDGSVIVDQQDELATQ